MAVPSRSVIGCGAPSHSVPRAMVKSLAMLAATVDGYSEFDPQCDEALRAAFRAARHGGDASADAQSAFDPIKQLLAPLVGSAQAPG